MSSQKKLYRAGPYADLFSEGVQVGEALYLAGQVGVDEKGRAPDDLVEQMKLAYANIQHVLAQFDATIDHLVEETWFVTDIEDCMSKAPALFSAREAIYGKKPEVAQTLVQVVALVDPSFKIEIKCVAAMNAPR